MKAIATRRAGKKYYSGTPHYSTAYNSFLEGARWCAKFKKYPRLSAKDSQFQDLENKLRNCCYTLHQMKKQKIWKFDFNILATSQTIRMPIGAEILTVQIQDGKPYLWAEIDADDKVLAEPEPRYIQVYETGQAMIGMSLDRKYIATIQIGQTVYHVFEYVPF